MAVEITVEETPAEPVEEAAEAVEEAAEAVGEAAEAVEEAAPAPTTDAVDAVEVGTLLAHENRITSLEARMAAVEEVAQEARTVSDIALNTAEANEEIATDTIEAIPELVEEEVQEAVEEEKPDEDNTPVKTHWLNRSWPEWKQIMGGKG